MLSVPAMKLSLVTQGGSMLRLPGDSVLALDSEVVGSLNRGKLQRRCTSSAASTIAGTNMFR